MSSNDSMSSSRLSQFGLYRTIDARTEEFLKLSRQRQIRQGCACAAVSTAVTVTVVVSVLFLYGYGVGSPSSTSLRTSSWLGLMNDSTDTTPFDEQFQNSIKFDRASMSLLPVFFDNILEDPESSSPKYEVSTEMDYKKSMSHGYANQFIAQAKIPSPGLYSIQYKTYPVLYIQNPRNTEYYMKVRKTREYERIMNYIDKMINEKVNFGTRSIRNMHYTATTEKYHRDSQTKPLAVHKTPRVITKEKLSKSSKIILHSNKNSKQTMSNKKFNISMVYDNRNCKCRKHFGILLDKILKCFQDLIKDSSEQSCKEKTLKNSTSQVKIQSPKKPITTTETTTKSMTSATTTTTSSTKPTTTTIFAVKTPNTVADIFSSTDLPAEILQFSHDFLQKPVVPDKTKIKPKALLSQMSPFYLMTENLNSKYNMLAPIKPKTNIFSANNQRSKFIPIQTHDKKKQNLLQFSMTEKNIQKSTTSSTSTPKTTTSFEKSEEVIQNLLFPETKVKEYAIPLQKTMKMYSTDYNILRPKAYKRMPTGIKPQSTTTIPTTSASYNLIKHPYDKHKNVDIDNDMGKTNIKPISISNSRPFSGMTPEDLIMKRLRESKKQNTKALQSPEPVIQDNKYEKGSNTNKSVFKKIVNLLKSKLMQPHRKTPYNNLSSRIIKSKTDSKYTAKQTSTPNNNKFNSKEKENTSQNYSKSLRTPFSSSTITNWIMTTTTDIPSVIEGNTSPPQLNKYPVDPFILEITTQPIIQESYHQLKFPKLQRSDKPHTRNSREDIWGEDDIDKTTFDETPQENVSQTTVAAQKNNSGLTSTTEGTIHVINSSIAPNEVRPAPVDLGFNKFALTQNNERNTWDSSQTEDNYTPYKYSIPVGRKSYLEISRGDWKQKDVDNTNVMYEAFDEIDGS